MPSGLDEMGQRTSLTHVLGPLLDFVTVEHDLSHMSEFEIADLVWNLYAATVSRVQGSEAFSSITDSQEHWNDLLVPLLTGRLARESRRQPTSRLPFRSLIACVIGAGGMVIESWFESGRWRGVCSTHQFHLPGCRFCRCLLLWWVLMSANEQGSRPKA